MSIIFDTEGPPNIGVPFSRNKIADRIRRIFTADQLLSILSAAGEFQPVDLLTPIDGKTETPWIAMDDPTDVAVNTTGGILASKAYFDMTGSSETAHFYNPTLALPASYFWCMVFRVQAVASSRGLMGADGSPAPVKCYVNGRSPTLYHASQDGDGTITGAAITGWSPALGSTLPALGSDCILWVSYDASTKNMWVGVNTIAAKHTNTGVPVPLVWNGMNVGGWCYGNKRWLTERAYGLTDDPPSSDVSSYNAPIALFVAVSGSLVGAGSDQVDRQRESLVRTLADNFGISVS